MAMTTTMGCLRILSQKSKYTISCSARTLLSRFHPWTLTRQNGISYGRPSNITCFTKRNLLDTFRNKTGIKRESCCRYLHEENNGLPAISEDDLEETFTRGHGPGGQSVNKSTNCCVLKHIPTGVAVKVHETRSLDQNRKIARLRLRQKLDQYLNKENSQREILKRQASANRKIKKRKTNERLEKLRAFKEREGLS